MNRGLRTLTFTLGAGMLLCVAGYLLSRPTWRTATESEIRAQLEPGLLTQSKEIPEARARYNRFTAIVGRIQQGGSAEVKDGETIRTVYTRVSEQWKTLDALLREGSIQAPLNTSTRAENERLTILVRELTQFAAHEIRDGSSEFGAWLLLLAIRMHKRLSEHSETMSDFLSGAARVGLLVQGLERSLSDLSERDLAKLAAEMPPSPSDDPVLLNALRDEVRNSFVPLLADPRGERIPDFAEDQPVRGNFDALETARDLNRALVPWQKNARHPRSQQDLTGDVYLRDLERSLPIRRRVGNSELARRFSEWRLAWEMARVPNSYGRRLLVGATNGAFQAFADTSYRRRALWEGMRATIALRRYRLTKGTAAPSLQALVDVGFLRALPFDHLGTGPLRYDPTRQVLWSIGTDGQDDGGTALPGVMGQSDIVWRTP